MKNAVVLLLVCFGLAACGQTGPLYLPQPTQAQPVIEPVVDPVEPAPAPLSTPAPSGSPAPEAVQETTTANPA